ncbi:MAG TPA: tRNA-dihydrouridine synthase family protein [Thermodesulfovibrionales bacterium]|nr:tRNA-dihydrouridine synthase family protein [Thermodesulfovibrionales bacterium]
MCPLLSMKAETNVRTPPQAMQIRNLLIDPPLFLAPMAGLTHSALRRIMIGFGGVGLLSTEMLSAKRLPTENPRISPYLIRTERESPLSYQLLTATDKEIGRAIDALHALKADAVDLNMGCPSPAVSKFGAGSMLMEQPEDARRIVAEARKRTILPLSAKIRLGNDSDSGKVKTFCSMLEGEGIDMLSVHARFTYESFARKPRWAHIAEIKECIKIPVIANGGVFSIEDAEQCLKVSGADGLMLGRGAVIKPWLFAEVARTVFHGDITEPAVSLPDVYAAFLEALDAYYRPIYCLGRLKEFTHYFARNYKFGHSLASKVQSSSSMGEARERAWTFFANNSKERMAATRTGVGDNENIG